MKNGLLCLFALSISTVLACSDAPSATETSLDELGCWYCMAIAGPVNDGPGSCPDCVAQLCVAVASPSSLAFAIYVPETPPYTTELCSLSSIVVKQSTTTLFENSFSIDPISVVPSFQVIGYRTP